MVIQIQRIVILVTCILLSDDQKIALGHKQACNVLSYRQTRGN